MVHQHPSDTIPATIVKSCLSLVQREYLIASAYLRQIGAQTPSREYGGSRSIIYYQMLQGCHTARQMWVARQQYRRCHTDPAADHDEYGGVLRILAYRLRHIPWVGNRLEQKVRADDAAMAKATFHYPDGYERISAPIDDIAAYHDTARIAA